MWLRARANPDQRDLPLLFFRADADGGAYKYALSLLDSTLLILNAAGFQELVYEDFYDVLISLIRQIVVPEPNGSTLTDEILLEAFQDAEGK